MSNRNPIIPDLHDIANAAIEFVDLVVANDLEKGPNSEPFTAQLYGDEEQVWAKLAATIGAYRHG